MLPEPARRDFPTVKEMTGWVFEALRGRAWGETISYAELSAILTLDAQGSRGRRAVLAAGRRLLVELADPRLLVNVRDVGYQIAKPNEHVKASGRYQRAARRRLARALLTVTHVVLDQLTDQEREVLIREQVRAGLSYAFTKRMARAKALPALEQAAVPRGAKLLQLLTQRKPEGGTA